MNGKLFQLLPIHFNKFNLLLIFSLFCNFVVRFNLSLFFYSKRCIVQFLNFYLIDDLLFHLHVCLEFSQVCFFSALLFDFLLAVTFVCRLVLQLDQGAPFVELAVLVFWDHAGGILDGRVLLRHSLRRWSISIFWSTCRIILSIQQVALVSSRSHN